MKSQKTLKQTKKKITKNTTKISRKISRNISRNKFQIGAHASIAKGVLNGIKYIQDIGGNAVQIFLGSTRSSSLKMKRPISDSEAQEIKNYITQNKIYLVIHSIYLLNFCSFPPPPHKNSKRLKYAIDNLIYDMNMASKIGAKGVVLHIGYQKTLPQQEAYQNMIANVKYVVDNTPSDVKVILETPAGQGTQIAKTLEEFAELYNMFTSKYKKRVTICIDTAHIFTSGNDIRTKKGISRYLRKFNKLIGFEHLSLFHINDSKVPLNSRRDVHQGIGDGYIFKSSMGGNIEALKTLSRWAKKHKIPMILETHGAGSYDNPKDKGQYQKEIRLIKGWFYSLPDKIDKIDKTDKNSKKITQKIMKTTNYLKFKNNKNIVDIFSLLSRYYRKTGDNIRANTYAKAVFQIKRYPLNITKGQDVKDLEGIGKKTVLKIDEILETGTLKLLDKLNIDSSKSKSNQIRDIFGFGPTIVTKLEKQGITTIKQLEKAMEKTIEKAIEKEMKKTVQKQGISLNYQQQIGLKYHSDLSKPISRKETKKIADKITKIIKTTKITKTTKVNNKIKNNPYFSDIKITLAGSYPSGKPFSKDIDLLISSTEIKNQTQIKNSKKLYQIIDVLTENGIITHTLSLGPSKFLGLVRLGPKKPHRHLDIRLVPESSFIFSYLYYVSGRTFNLWMRNKAKKMGYLLNEWGLYDSNGKAIPNIKTERDIFDILEIDYLPIENRR